MATAKNKVFIRLLLENCCLVREMNFWCGNKSLVRGKSTREIVFLMGWRMSKFQTGGRTLPSRENPVIPYIKAKKKNSFYNLENLKS